MRTTISLEKDVYEAAQSMARASGKRLGEVVSLLARRGLRSSIAITDRSGLPVFQVAPDAEVIPSTRASELLADDAT